MVFEADWSVYAGRQFDRTAEVWVGGTNVYFGTTAEPSRMVERSWHVESNLTEYTPLFAIPQQGRVDLGNLVNQTYTSHLHG
ncbi:MAG TPA: peptide-N4-asparagine amidase, partial [Terriglobales bacterium]